MAMNYYRPMAMNFGFSPFAFLFMGNAIGAVTTAAVQGARQPTGQAPASRPSQYAYNSRDHYADGYIGPRQSGCGGFPMGIRFV